MTHTALAAKKMTAWGGPVTAPGGRHGVLVAAVLVALGAVVADVRPATATSFTVTSTADLVDATIGDGICAAAGGACTLRAAVQEANMLGGSNTIDLPAGTYTLTIAGRNEDAAATGDLDILTALDITGAGAGSTVVRAGTSLGNGVDRVFHVHQVPFQLAEVTVAYGRLVDSGAAGDGAGILNNGDSTVLRTRVHACTAVSSGGGIQTTGTATLVISESLVDGSWAQDGGGLSVAGGGMAHASNLTVTGNSATSLGGGLSVAFNGELTLASSTIAGNQSDSILGGGISNAGTVHLKGSIVAANTNQGFSSGNCAGSVPVTSDGYNVDDATSCGLTGVGDRSSLDPQLGSLADNGGWTLTLAVPAGSPTVDTGHPSGCTSAQGSPLTTDQRGFARPVDGDGNGSAICDVGAFELQPDSLLFADGFESSGTDAWSVVIP